MEKRRVVTFAASAILFAGALTTLAACSSDDSDSGTTSADQSSTATGGGTYGSNKVPDSDQNASGGEGQQAQSGQAAGGNAAAQPGQYLDYSPELVASTPGDKLLFFHAPWCSQCVALEDDIEASGVPDGVTIFKVDYDSNQDLRQEYGVTIQTTLVKVDDNGDLIDSYVAYEDPTLDNVSAALLQ